MKRKYVRFFLISSSVVVRRSGRNGNSYIELSSELMT